MKVPSFCGHPEMCNRIADGSWMETPAIARSFAAELAKFDLSVSAHILACLSVKGRECTVIQSGNKGLIDLVWEAMADRGDILSPDEPEFRQMVEDAKSKLRNS